MNLRLMPVKKDNPEIFSGTIIETELVRSLHFPKHEILISAGELEIRRDDVNYLKTLKKLHEIQVRIYFEDIEGSKLAITRLIGITDSEIIISKNLAIPIHRIVRITIN